MTFHSSQSIKFFFIYTDIVWWLNPRVHERWKFAESWCTHTHTEKYLACGRLQRVEHMKAARALVVVMITLGKKIFFFLVFVLRPEIKIVNQQKKISKKKLNWLGSSKYRIIIPRNLNLKFLLKVLAFDLNLFWPV